MPVLATCPAPSQTAPAAAAAALPGPQLDLQLVVQNALQDLLESVSLQHEDSWDAAGGPAATGATASAAPPPRRKSTSISTELSGDPSEHDLPPAAAARLYRARLHQAQAERAGLMAALEARDARLSDMEKEVQQLRCVGAQRMQGEGGHAGPSAVIARRLPGNAGWSGRPG